jgi:5-(carboxyamino)imidazole ribonucleotide synthase
MQKLRTTGYDGRGVYKINSKHDLEDAFEEPSVLERFVEFEKELSVIVARNASGGVKTFPAVEMMFHPEANIVEFLLAPATVSPSIEKRAEKIACDVARALDIIGLAAVEMFVMPDGNLLVNEIAPRPHNSGHHTIEANMTSQYEQHLRAILNLPLGSTATKSPAVMVNLLGEEGYEGIARYEGIEDVLAMEGTTIHLYGKNMTKPFRKMGHITILDQDIQKALQKARYVKQHVKVIA